MAEITQGTLVRAFRAGLSNGQTLAAWRIRSAILDLLQPDDPPAREYVLRQCVEIVERAGGLDPIPGFERTDHA